MAKKRTSGKRRPARGGKAGPVAERAKPKKGGGQTPGLGGLIWENIGKLIRLTKPISRND
jgi:hypothetical protein